MAAGVEGRHWATYLEIKRCRGTPRDRDRDGQQPVGSWGSGCPDGERLGDTALKTKGSGHLSTVAPSD